MTRDAQSALRRIMEQFTKGQRGAQPLRSPHHRLSCG